MAISIDAERVKQVTDVAKAFTEGFKPFDSDFTREEFLTVYDETIAWYDHGFHNVRLGHEAVLGLHKGFLHCNQPFKATIKSLHVTTEGCVLQQVWEGNCANDIVRPDGQVVVKATQRDFVCHVAFILAINQAGKITRIDEYDYRAWAEGKPEDQYTQIGQIGQNK